MRQFSIEFTKRGRAEFKELKYVIRDVYKAPVTAQRYVTGLMKRIRTLQNGADMYAVIPELSLEYGMDVRRINYKQIAVIYSYIYY